MKKTEDIKTESLTLTIKNIPSGLMDMMWDKMFEYSITNTKKVNKITFDFNSLFDDEVASLTGSAITLHFRELLAKNIINK